MILFPSTVTYETINENTLHELYASKNDAIHFTLAGINKNECVHIH